MRNVYRRNYEYISHTNLSDRRFVRAIKEFLRTAPLKVMDIGHLCNALVKLEGHVDLLDVFKDLRFCFNEM